MRGSVWPGACATALRDLQKALTSKSLNGSLQSSQTSQSPGINDPRSVETSSTNPHILQNRQRQDRIPAFQSTTTFRGNETTSPSTANSYFRPMSSQQSSRVGGPHNDRGPATSMSQSQSQPVATVYQPDQFPDPTLLGMNGMFDLGEQFDGVGDIFQLMDASYQLGEQMFEPSFGGRH